MKPRLYKVMEGASHLQGRDAARGVHQRICGGLQDRTNPTPLGVRQTGVAMTIRRLMEEEKGEEEKGTQLFFSCVPFSSLWFLCVRL
jgi:hypothetical protein